LERASLSVRRGDELGLSSEDFGKLAQVVLENGQFFRFRAKGYSMTPCIKDNKVLMSRTGIIPAFVFFAVKAGSCLRGKKPNL
jgi:hypothetical protein